MNTKIEVKEMDLIKVKTIKRKHAEQVRDPVYHTEHAEDLSGYEVMGYINQWNALLVKQKETEHYRVIHTSTYTKWLAEVEPNLTGPEVYKRSIAFPQLFLD